MALMGRLAKGPSLLGAGPRRVERATPVDEAGRSRYRDETQEHRAWYKTARWQKLVMRIRQRDGYVCRKTGVILSGKAPAPNSPVVDHIVPHRGDPVLFWDETNLQTVSKVWHDSEKQRQERAAGR